MFFYLPLVESWPAIPATLSIPAQPWNHRCASSLHGRRAPFALSYLVIAYCCWVLHLHYMSYALLRLVQLRTGIQKYREHRGSREWRDALSFGVPTALTPFAATLSSPCRRGALHGDCGHGDGAPQGEAPVLDHGPRV